MGDRVSELESMIEETQKEIERMRSDVLAGPGNLVAHKSRALSLVQTKLDEARLWLREAR